MENGPRKKQTILNNVIILIFSCLICLSDNIMEVFLDKYEPTYVKYYFTKSIKAFLNDEEHFQVNDDALGVFFEVLEEINPKIVTFLP